MSVESDNKSPEKRGPTLTEIRLGELFYSWAGWPGSLFYRVGKESHIVQYFSIPIVDLFDQEKLPGGYIKPELSVSLDPEVGNIRGHVFNAFDQDRGYRVDTEDFNPITRKEKLSRVREEIQYRSDDNFGYFKVIVGWDPYQMSLDRQRKANRLIQDQAILWKLRAQVFIHNLAFEAIANLPLPWDCHLQFDRFYPLDTGPLLPEQGQRILFTSDPKGLENLAVKVFLSGQPKPPIFDPWEKGDPGRRIVAEVAKNLAILKDK